MYSCDQQKVYTSALRSANYVNTSTEEKNSMVPLMRSILDPTVIAQIPDESMIARITKQVNFNTNLTGYTNYLLWYTPFSREAVITVYYSNNTTQWTYLTTITGDQDLGESFSLQRPVCGKINVFSNTIASGAVTIQGSTFAVSYQDPINFQGITPEVAMSARVTDADAVINTNVADGVCVLSGPPPNLTFVPCQSDILAAQGDKFDFNSYNTDPAILQVTTATGVSVITSSGWNQTPIGTNVLATVYDSANDPGNGINNTVIPVGLRGITHYKAEFIIVPVTPNPVDAVGGYFYLDVFKDDGSPAATFAYRFDAPAGASAKFTYFGDLESKVNLARFRWSALIIGWQTGSPPVNNTFVVSGVVSLSNETAIRPGETSNGSLIYVTNVAATQTISVNAVMNYEVVPNSTLARNLKVGQHYGSVYPKSSDIDLVNYLFMNRDTSGFKLVYPLSDYQIFLREQKPMIESDRNRMIVRTSLLSDLWDGVKEVGKGLKPVVSSAAHGLVNMGLDKIFTSTVRDATAAANASLGSNRELETKLSVSTPRPRDSRRSRPSYGIREVKIRIAFDKLGNPHLVDEGFLNLLGVGLDIIPHVSDLADQADCVLYITTLVNLNLAKQPDKVLSLLEQLETRQALISDDKALHWANNRSRRLQLTRITNPSPVRLGTAGLHMPVLDAEPIRDKIAVGFRHDPNLWAIVDDYADEKVHTSTVSDVNFQNFVSRMRPEDQRRMMDAYNSLSQESKVSAYNIAPVEADKKNYYEFARPRWQSAYLGASQESGTAASLNKAWKTYGLRACADFKVNFAHCLGVKNTGDGNLAGTVFKFMLTRLPFWEHPNKKKRAAYKLMYDSDGQKVYACINDWADDTPSALFSRMMPNPNYFASDTSPLYITALTKSIIQGESNGLALYAMIALGAPPVLAYSGGLSIDDNGELNAEDVAYANEKIAGAQTVGVLPFIITTNDSYDPLLAASPEIASATSFNIAVASNVYFAVPAARFNVTTLLLVIAMQNIGVSDLLKVKLVDRAASELVQDEKELDVIQKLPLSQKMAVVAAGNDYANVLASLNAASSEFRTVVPQANADEAFDRLSDQEIIRNIEAKIANNEVPGQLMSNIDNVLKYVKAAKRAFLTGREKRSYTALMTTKPSSARQQVTFGEYLAPAANRSAMDLIRQRQQLAAQQRARSAVPAAQPQAQPVAAVPQSQPTRSLPRQSAFGANKLLPQVTRATSNAPSTAPNAFPAVASNRAPSIPIPPATALARPVAPPMRRSNIPQPLDSFPSEPQYVAEAADNLASAQLGDVDDFADYFLE